MKNIEGQIEVFIRDLLYIGAKREEGNADTLKSPGTTEKNYLLILNSSKRSTFCSIDLRTKWSEQIEEQPRLW